jgi:hypothetical protein
MAKRVPGDPLQPSRLVILASRPERGLRSSDSPHELPAHRTVGTAEDGLIGVVGALAAARRVNEGRSCRSIQGKGPPVAILPAPHREKAGEQVRVAPNQGSLLRPAEACFDRQSHHRVALRRQGFQHRPLTSLAQEREAPPGLLPLGDPRYRVPLEQPEPDRSLETSRTGDRGDD